MKRFIIPFLFFILIMLAFAREYTQDYNNPLTRSIADNRYCIQNGICNLSILTTINHTVLNENSTNITTNYLTVNQESRHKDTTIFGDIDSGDYIKIRRGFIEGIPFMISDYSSVGGFFPGVMVQNSSIIVYSGNELQNPQIILVNTTNILGAQGNIEFDLENDVFEISTTGNIPIVIDSEADNLTIKDDVVIQNGDLQIGDNVRISNILNISTVNDTILIGRNTGGATSRIGSTIGFHPKYNYTRIKIYTPLADPLGATDPYFTFGYTTVLNFKQVQVPTLKAYSDGFIGGILAELFTVNGLYSVGRPVKGPLAGIDAVIKVYHQNFTMIGSHYADYNGALQYSSANNRVEFITDSATSFAPDMAFLPKGKLKIPQDNKALYFGNGEDTYMLWDSSNFIINTTTGNVLIYNSTGWGLIEAHDLITHTHNETSNNPLETFINPNDYKECEIYTEHKNLSDCWKVYDYSNWCYINASTLCTRDLSTIQEDLRQYFKETKVYKKECGTYMKKGESAGCVQANIIGTLVDLNHNINILANLTDFDTSIMAEEIYTQSKTIDINEDYYNKFTIEQLRDKETHKNYERNILGSNKDGLNMEDRIVDLEGVILDLKVEIETLRKDIENLKNAVK